MGSAQTFANIWRRMGGSKTYFGPKHVANEFLNNQFGWVPFLSDLRAFHDAWKNADEAVKRIRRYNGQWVKRGGSVKAEEKNMLAYEDSKRTAHWPILTTGFYAPIGDSISGAYKVTQIESEVIWFSGSFKYWIPDIDSVQWERKARRQLFGLNINPSLVWELTPWSWLIDWFSSTGDAIANMDNLWAENLVAKQAYIMGTTENSFQVESRHDLKPTPIHATWNSGVIRKSRMPASPFGFGLTSGDLTGRQTAILGALGVSKNF